MRTYLLLHIDSEGSSYSELASLVENIGFRPHVEGGYDFVYDWGRDASVGESLEFADRLQTALQGHSTYFRVESITE